MRRRKQEKRKRARNASENENDSEFKEADGESEDDERGNLHFDQPIKEKRMARRKEVLQGKKKRN